MLPLIGFYPENVSVKPVHFCHRNFVEFSRILCPGNEANAVLDACDCTANDPNLLPIEYCSEQIVCNHSDFVAPELRANVLVIRPTQLTMALMPYVNLSDSLSILLGMWELIFRELRTFIRYQRHFQSSQLFPARVLEDYVSFVDMAMAKKTRDMLNNCQENDPMMPGLIDSYFVSIFGMNVLANTFTKEHTFKEQAVIEVLNLDYPLFEKEPQRWLAALSYNEYQS